MEQEKWLESMGKFGLSRIEATLYYCLLKNGEMTGYEAAKATGISRSNVYNGLASLVEKGCAYVKEEQKANVYLPAQVEEFTSGHLSRLSALAKEVVKAAPRQVEIQDGYITIRGEDAVHSKIRQMLGQVEQRFYFSADEENIVLFMDEIIKVIKGGKKCVLILNKCQKVCKLLEQELSDKEVKHLFVYQSKSKANQFRLICDSTYVLTGELGLGNDNALYSAQPNFVMVFKEAMANEIELIKRDMDAK